MLLNMKNELGHNFSSICMEESYEIQIDHHHARTRRINERMVCSVYRQPT